jgi:hypothetical protein
MKRTIPFDLFGEKQELCFTIGGLAELERKLGKPIQQIIASENAGFDFCLSALPICLERIQPHLYEEKIEQYINEDEHTINDIAIPIIQAIVVKGALGKKYADVVLAMHYPELYAQPTTKDEAGKNV